MRRFHFVFVVTFKHDFCFFPRFFSCYYFPGSAVISLNLVFIARLSDIHLKTSFHFLGFLECFTFHFAPSRFRVRFHKQKSFPSNRISINALFFCVRMVNHRMRKEIHCPLHCHLRRRCLLRTSAALFEHKVERRPYSFQRILGLLPDLAFRFSYRRRTH